MPVISELVGRKGAYPLLSRALEKKDVITAEGITELVEEVGASYGLFSELTESGIFIESPVGFYLSSFGRKTTLLLRALNGDEEVSEVFRQLAYLYPSLRPYELITESVTDYFVDNLYAQSDFIRVSICSPWIRLTAEHMQKFEASLLKASRQYPNLQVLVITLPLQRYRDRQAIETVKMLKNLGADIVVNSRLHAKLYISEPGAYGGRHYAIFGSENLTGRGNIELAIKVENDNEILRRLNLYFLDIWENSQIIEEV